MAQPASKRILGLVAVLLIGAGAAVLAWRLTAGGDKRPSAPAAEQPPDAMPVDPDVKRTGEGTFTIERAAWEEWMKSPSQMVTGVKAVAAMKDSIQHGFALQEIKAGSIAARLGLRSGDVITHMNEVPLSSLVGVMRTVATLRTAAQVIIRFQRGGQDLVHTYGIVPPPAPPPTDAAPPPDPDGGAARQETKGNKGRRPSRGDKVETTTVPAGVLDRADAEKARNRPPAADDPQVRSRDDDSPTRHR